MRKKLEFKVRHVNGFGLNVLKFIKGTTLLVVHYYIEKHWLLSLLSIRSIYLHLTIIQILYNHTLNQGGCRIDKLTVEPLRSDLLQTDSK